VNLQSDDWPSDLVSILLFLNDMITQLEMLQSVSQQHLPCAVKKSLLVAVVHGHPVFAEIGKFDQDKVIHDWKPLPFAMYFDCLLCAAQQADQDAYDGAQQCQLKHVVHDCKPISDGCAVLSLSPSTPTKILPKEDVQDVVVKISSSKVQ